MLPTFQLRKSFHRRNPPATPAAPPTGPRVVGVVFRPLESDVALYVFSEDVEDPQGDIGDLVVGGLSAISWDRASDTELLVSFPANLAPGMAWSNPDGAAGIVSLGGEPLAAASGTVS